MARAKRTDRTEARRRRRAEQATLAGDGVTLDEGGVGTSGTGTSGAGPSRTGQPAVQRPSITAALRGAFRPLDLSGDLRALPRLLRHWSFWGPAALTVATTVLYISSAQGRTADTASDTWWVVVNLAFQMFVFPLPAPAGSAFIAGFGAPRASWLVGLLIGILSAACFAVIVNSVAASLTTATPAAATDIQALALQGFLVAPIGSSLFAAAAAWYKRFLNLANPNRRQRRTQPQRVQQGRGNITRDRLSH